MDDILAELIEWWEDVTIDGIGSRLVLVPVQSGWGRTTLLERFAAHVDAANGFSFVIRVDGLACPPEPGVLAKRFDDLTADSFVALGKELLGLDSPEGLAIMGIQVTNLSWPILGGLIGLVVQVGLGAESALRHRLFPGPVGRAMTAGNRLAKASVEAPVVVLVDDAEHLDCAVADAFLSGLLDRVNGSVLSIVAGKPSSELFRRLGAPDRSDLVADRIHVMAITDASMGPADRRALGGTLAPSWPTVAVDRMIEQTSTFVEVRQVTGAPGAAEVATATDPVACVDELVRAVLPPPEASDAAVVVAWCGGVMHSVELAAVLEAAHLPPVWPGDVRIEYDVARLAKPGTAAAFRALVPARFDRRSAAETIAKTAATLTSDTGLDLARRVAALRPIPVLLAQTAPCVLEANEATLAACHELVRLLREVGDSEAARQLAETSVHLAQHQGVNAPVVEHLAGEALKLAAITGAIPAITLEPDPESGALFGLEARVWNAVLRLTDPSRQGEGVELAARLMPVLDPDKLGDVALGWRLQLGAALARAGLVDLARSALSPLLSLPESHELRGTAERVSARVPGLAGDVLLAIAALEPQLALTPEHAIDDRLRLTAALGPLYGRVGLWKQARSYAADETRMRGDMQGPGHLDTLVSRGTLAHWTGLAGDPRTAVTLFEELFPDAERALGKHHRFTLVTSANLAHSIGEAGDPHRALAMFHALLAERTRLLGRDDVDTLIARGNVARWTGEAGDARRAVALFAELLPDVSRLLGWEHPHTLTTRGGQARWTGVAGNWRRAGALFALLLDDRSRVLGPYHPDTLTTRGNLAHATGEAGKPYDAKALVDQLILDFELVLGLDHPYTLVTRGHVAYLAGEGGDPQLAAALYEGLVSDTTRVLGDDHPDTLIARGNLATWIGEAGDPKRAMAFLEALLYDVERVLGCAHPQMLTTRRKWAYWVGETGYPSQARALLDELSIDQTRILGPDHPYTLATKIDLGRWTGEAGDPSSAKSLFHALLPDAERVLGPNHPDTLTVRRQLARWTGEGGDPRRAKHLLETLIPDVERVLGPDHPQTLTTRRVLAEWTGRAGDVKRARSLLQAVLSDVERVLGPGHPETLACLRVSDDGTGAGADPVG